MAQATPPGFRLRVDVVGNQDIHRLPRGERDVDFRVAAQVTGEEACLDVRDDSRLVGASIPETPTAAWFAGGIVERRKLEEYLLSPTHPDGKNKLRLWRGAFGIQEGDAELLEHLTREHLSQAVPQQREPLTKRGDPPVTYRRWELVIPRFRGPNGNVGPVLTAWALDPGRDLPHLTTARPLVGR